MIPIGNALIQSGLSDWKHPKEANLTVEEYLELGARHHDNLGRIFEQIRATLSEGTLPGDWELKGVVKYHESVLQTLIHLDYDFLKLR